MSNKDVSLALLVVFIWGVNFSVIKLGIDDAIDPFMLAAMRFFFTAIPLVFFLPRPNIKLSIIALYGVLFGVGFWGLVNLGIYLGVSPGVGSLVLQFSAYFTVILGCFLFTEKLNNVQILGIAISFIGLCVLIFIKDTAAPIFGLALVILGALSWSITNVIVKKTTPKNVIAFIAWSSLFSPVPLVLLSYLTNADFSFYTAILGLSYLGVFSVFFQVYITTLFGYWVWNSLIKKYPISQVAPISLLVPVFGFLASIVLFNEAITFAKLISSALILLGLILFVFNKKIS